MKFSQNEEEKHILNYFNGRGGTFLDLGCNDCKTFSNTRALALTGLWKGVLVDCSPKAIERCKEIYNGNKNFYIYPYAVSGHNGKAILQESGALCTTEDVGLVSTFHQSEVARFSRTVKYTPVEVKTFKWKTFLNRLKIKEFTFISMDIENDELNVLPDMDLTKTELICIEHNGSDQRKKDYLHYTSMYGLSRIIYESGENLLIARV
jgi:FkbM family methyltransferase